MRIPPRYFGWAQATVTVTVVAGSVEAGSAVVARVARVPVHQRLQFQVRRCIRMVVRQCHTSNRKALPDFPLYKLSQCAESAHLFLNKA
jgi:hypothetical protein